MTTGCVSDCWPHAPADEMCGHCQTVYYRIPTPEQVEEFGARIIAEINDPGWLDFLTDDRLAADRKRVESDVRAYRRNTEGLRQHALAPNGWECSHGGRNDSCPDAARYTAGRDEAWQNLRDTGALCGVTPTETS